MDPHNGGRTVMKLHFEGGGSLYYKPRPVDMEEAWSCLCHWLAAERAPVSPRPLDLLRRRGYGWVRDVEAALPSGGGHAAAYLHAFGGMLCLAHWLGASDLHAENFFHGSDGPVAVDLETLLHAGLQRSPSVPSPDPAGVMGTMMLPLEYAGHGGQTIVLPGALADGSGGAASPAFLAVNSDAMRRSPQRPPDPAAPAGGLREQTGGNVEAVRRGFEETYRFLLLRRRMLVAGSGPLSAFKDCRQRFVYRSTDLYARLLHHGLEPDNLVDGVAWSLTFDILHRFDDTGLAPDLAEELHAAERRALARLDVPYFTGSSSGLRVSEYGSSARKEAFGRPAFDALHERVEAMSLEDMAAQVATIG